MDESLVGMLRCPDCLGSDFATRQGAPVCASCGRELPWENGVLDARPRQGLRMPRMYQDKDYLRWNESWQEGHDYCYETGGLLSWVQGAGHRAIAAWRRGETCGAMLDVGCGDGAHLGYAGAVRTYVGLDLDQGGLERLGPRRPAPIEALHAVRGDAYTLPFADRAFDAVVSVYSLEHLVYLDLALEEVRRVLAPGGSFYASVPNEGGLAWGLGRRLTTARRFNSQTFDYDRAVAIEHVNCVWQIERAVRRHFSDVAWRRFPVPLPIRHCNLVTTMRCRN